jgi:hypothetical protein
MVNSAHLETRLERLAAVLQGHEQQAWRASAHVSRNLVPGEFRSPYRLPFGLERDIPRVFTQDDDAAHIDTRRVGPSMAIRSVGEAILRGELRLVQSIHHAEAEFMIVVDVSRSILSGCFLGRELESLAEPSTSKLQALYLAVAAYLQIAEATGFAVRAIYLCGRSPEEERSRAPRHFAQRVLVNMSRYLVESYRSAENDPDHREEFLLAYGLNMTLRIHTRSIVVVVSDFLDDWSGYADTLKLVLGRHHTVLLDVASNWDRAFPLPNWRDDETRRVPACHGACHLEEGTRRRIPDRRTIADWNRRRTADQEQLRSLADQYSTSLVPCQAQSYEDIYLQAVQVFDRVR